MSYRAARERAALFHRDDRALVRATGRDPLRMVQGILTHDLAGAPDDRAVPAALLTPKGRMVADVRAFRGGDRVFLETSTAALPALLEYVKKYVPPLFARFEAVEEARVLGVYGPHADAAVSELLPDIAKGAPEYALGYDGETTWLRTRYAGEDGWDLIAAADVVASLESRLLDAGVPLADEATLEVLRIEAGRPRFGAELGEDVIPLEAELHDWISTTKGCYTGQEVIIRILHRGHVNRHLRGFLLGAQTVETGAEVTHPETGKVVGRITSTCESPRVQQRIGLGYARRELSLPAEVRLPDGGSATVVQLPFAAD